MLQLIVEPVAQQKQDTVGTIELPGGGSSILQESSSLAVSGGVTIVRDLASQIVVESNLAEENEQEPN